jgi:predicted ATPase
MNLDFADRSDPVENAEAEKPVSRMEDQVAPEKPASPPLIGRDAELSLLKDRWEQTQEGRSQVVLVVGEAGLGKSRLVRTMARLLREDAQAESGVMPDCTHEDLVVEWRCSQQFQHSELYPVSECITRVLDFAADQSPGARFERLAQHLEDYGSTRPESIGLLAKLLFLPPDERYAITGLTPAREREETFRALHQWLRTHSAKQPTLFIVEDLHWSDASTLEFLGQFISQPEPDRVLAVLTFRPEFKVPWASAPNQTILALNRLTRRQVTEWVRKDARGMSPESLVTQIYQRTGGVPLLVEEFTRIVRESPAFQPERGEPRSVRQ